MLSENKQRTPEVVRRNHLAEKVVFVDGLGGCGKTMLSPIIASLERVELMTYAYEIEQLCSLYFLERMSEDAVRVMIRLCTDLQLYNTMMSREVNFRPSDLSGVIHDARPLRYVKRLFQEGDAAVLDRIKRESPILHLTTHELTAFSEPIFSALGERVVFIEVVRHPLYMLKQQARNMEGFRSDGRDFSICIRHDDASVPYFTRGWEDVFLSANTVEKAIYYMQHLTMMTEATKKKLHNRFGAQIVTIPFERFVIDPEPYMEKIVRCIGTTTTSATHRVMKKQHVPRKKYAEGIALKIYERCGWEPSKYDATESQEFEDRWQFARQRASSEAIAVLDQLCITYEECYLGGKKKNGDRYV